METQNLLSLGEEESKLSSTKYTIALQTCSSDASATKSACSMPQWNGYVYKRRKLHRNSLVFLQKQSATASLKESFGDNCNILSEDHHPQKTVILLNSHIEPVPLREEVPIKTFIINLQKYEPEHSSEHSSTVNGRCLALKSNVRHCSTSTKTAVEDAGESSSFYDFVTEPIGKFTSVKEYCISVLKSHGLLEEERTSTPCAPIQELPGNLKISLPCKMCGLLENPVEMLLCDFCEEAFHLSCCKPKVKKLPVDEWYCQPCFKKKKTSQNNITGKSFNSVDKMINKGKTVSIGNQHPVSLMLKDIEPYISLVRIGKDFQAEVPDWSGPIYEEHHFENQTTDQDCFHTIGSDPINTDHAVRQLRPRRTHRKLKVSQT